MSNSDQMGHLLSRRHLATFGLGLAATFALPGARAGGTSLRDPLEPWTAKNGQSATILVDPSHIDDRAVEELAFYHPLSVHTRKYSLKHISARDEHGPYARVTELSDNWNEKMAEVQSALRLRPETIRGVSVLIDRSLRDAKTREMHGWKATQWLVVKNYAPDLTLLHQDYITWEKADRKAISMFSWRPYE